MKDKHIFITGGTGFFGKNLIYHCSELKDNDVLILSRDPGKILKEFPFLESYKRMQFIQGDVRDFEFPENNFDYIYHGATTSSQIIPDDEIRSVVIDGARHVLDFAKQNRQLLKLLYVSSGAVYGKKYNIPVKEDFSCVPADAYGQSKLEAEKMCLEAGIPCCIARCFAFVGEYLPLDAHFAIGNFISDCLNNRPIIIKGDGTPTRSYLYSGDLAYWLLTILFSGKAGQIYNVGSDQEISIGKLAVTVKEVAGTNNEVKILTPRTDAHHHRYVPDISKAQNELGLEVKTSLEEAIRITLDFYLAWPAELKAPPC